MRLKNRTRTMFTAVVAAAVMLTTACSGGSGGESSGTPQDGGSITIGVGEPLTSWNPETILTVTDYQIVKEVFEPLVVNNADASDVQPALADSFSYNATKTVLTFELPKNATFSDGTPLTSADVAFSVEAWKKGSSGPLYAGIESIDTPSPTKVIFNLDGPNTSLLPILTWASSAVVRKDYGGMSKDEYFANPVGSGPFVVDDYKAGATEIVLKKNPTYHKKDLPRLDEVIYKVTSDANQRVLQYKSGEIDVYDQVSPDLLSQLPQDDIKTSPGAVKTALAFNVRDGAGIVSDVNFRKAVSLAIDRKGLVNSVYAGEGSVAKAGLTARVPGAVDCDECDYPEQDIAGAKAALAKSSYDGETVELVVDSLNATGILASQAMQPMLKDVGINITVKPQDTTTLISRALEGDLEVSYNTYRATSITLNDQLSLFASTESYFSGADPAPLFEGAAAVGKAQDTAALQAAAEGIEQYLFEIKYWVPLADLNVIFAINPRVRGLVVNPVLLYNLSEIYVVK